MLLDLLLRHTGHWLSLAEIRSGAPGIPDRTLRRWLGELAKEGRAERSGTLKGTRYRISAAEPRAPAAQPFASQVFSAGSLALVKRIEAPIYTRPPATYSEDWIDSYIPNQTSYLTAEQLSKLAALGKRAPAFGLARTYIQKIYDRLLIDLSYNSARLEGNTYTLADTEQLVLRGVAAQGKPNADRIMILNHKEAIRYLVQHVDTLTVNEESVRTIHYLLADSLVAPGLAGQIREEGVAVSGTTYAPLEGRERLSRLFLQLLEKARQIANPFEQSFFLLGHIAYLQAFADVNKRTARLASIIPLIANDFVPQSFVDVDKDAYLKATIVFYELNDTRPLADLYCWAYRRTCQHFDTSVQAVGFDEIAAAYRPQRRAIVADMVRGGVPLERARTFLDVHLPPQVDASHREKFRSDVLAELENLDASRIAGLGITREQLEDWLALRGRTD